MMEVCHSCPRISRNPNPNAGDKPTILQAMREKFEELNGEGDDSVVQQELWDLLGGELRYS